MGSSWRDCLIRCGTDTPIAFATAFLSPTSSVLSWRLVSDILWSAGLRERLYLVTHPPLSFLPMQEYTIKYWDETLVMICYRCVPMGFVPWLHHRTSTLDGVKGYDSASDAVTHGSNTFWCRDSREFRLPLPAGRNNRDVIIHVVARFTDVEVWSARSITPSSSPSPSPPTHIGACHLSP